MQSPWTRLVVWILGAYGSTVLWGWIFERSDWLSCPLPSNETGWLLLASIIAPLFIVPAGLLMLVIQYLLPERPWTKGLLAHLAIGLFAGSAVLWVFYLPPEILDRIRQSSAHGQHSWVQPVVQATGDGLLFGLYFSCLPALVGSLLSYPRWPGGRRTWWLVLLGCTLLVVSVSLVEVWLQFAHRSCG